MNIINICKYSPDLDNLFFKKKSKIMNDIKLLIKNTSQINKEHYTKKLYSNYSIGY